MESSEEPLSATITAVFEETVETTKGRNFSRNFFPFQFKITTATCGAGFNANKKFVQK